MGDTVSCAFYRLPKLFFCDDRYKSLSTDAKLLYALLLDRMELSACNGWQDELGRVYLYFTLEQVSELLAFGEKKVTRLFRELEKIGLIDRRKQGFCKASVIYPRKFSGYIGSKGLPRKGQNDCSITAEMTAVDKSKARINHTEYNHTEISDTNLSSEEIDVEWITQKVKMQIDYDILSERSDYNKMDEILRIIVEIMCTTSPRIRIGEREYAAEFVKDRFSQLDSGHMEYVHDVMSEVTTPIRDIKSYLTAVLFNAPATMEHYYQAAVKADFGY